MADDIDLAEETITAERDAGVARAQSMLQPSGAEDCSRCGDMLSEARRAAAPFATRCVPCQSIVEAAR